MPNAPDGTSSDNELYAKIVEDLENRSSWESRQILWNRMRTLGVPRSRKPWPGAADVHLPIGDTIIGKLKAYYVQWIFGPELLASFYSMNSQGDSYTSSVAQWFDYQVRECSNFTETTICAIDSCLQNGAGYIKTYWDSSANEVAFASIDPYFIITPTWTQDIQKADRLVHVMHISEDDYQRSGEDCGYNMDEEFIESITGEGKPDRKYEESRYVAEGLSYSGLDDLIILWECYTRQQDKSVLVQTFSPLQPDKPARAPFRLPYQHRQVPIVQVPYELINPSFYSSRGVMELVQMFEASGNKMWNEKLDFMSIANRPVLSTQGGSINAQNIRWQPGAVYDSTLQLVQQPPPPVSFDEEIQNTRSIAEQRVGIPDFGVGDQSGSQGKNKTATETNVITNVMQQSNDLRARVLKGAISRVYEQAWGILKQYNKKSLDYFWRKQRMTLPDAALDNTFALRPNGSTDGYSREREIQKLMQIRQLAQNAPWIKINEIDRKIIELTEAQWVAEVYVEPEQANANQQEDQAIENSTMQDGYLPNVLPTDDHVVHLQTADGFIGWAGQNQRPLSPVVMSIFMQHMTMHVQAARADSNYMKQHGPDIVQFANKIAATQKQMAQAQQAQAATSQQAQTALGNLRGGGSQGIPPGMGWPGAPNGAPTPIAPPSLPQPGQPVGAGPSMPPGGMPPNPANGATPAI